GRSLINRLERSIRCGSFFTRRQGRNLSFVVHIKKNSISRNILHVRIGDINFLYYTSSISSGFKTYTYICSQKGVVIYENVPCSTRHFATYNKASMSMKNDIISNDNLFCWNTSLSARFITT